MNKAKYIMIPILLALMAGCADIGSYLPDRQVQLSAKDEARLGSAVEDRLLQMLGGRFHDSTIAEDLRQRGASLGMSFDVADRSRAEIYALPGSRVLLTRGLLMRLDSADQLNSLLRQAAFMSRNALMDQRSRALSQAVTEFFATKPVLYDPEAADIRLARLFADRPCRESCLEVALAAGSTRNKLPDGFAALKDSRAGYELLIKAGGYEQDGDQRQAINAYLQAATEAPDKAQILGHLGMAYLRAGDLQSARLHLEKADRLQPAYYKTKMGLGYVFLQTGDVKRARVVLAESVRLLPVTENLFLLAEATEKGGNFAEAQSLYAVVVDHDRYSKLGRTAASRLQALRGN